MKKYTIIAISFLILVTVALYGQLNPTKQIPQSDNKSIYCELWEQNHGNINTNLFLNFGIKSKYQKETEESDYVKTQKDAVDALNYMSGSGWELISKNSRELDGGIETCYVLRKKMK